MKFNAQNLQSSESSKKWDWKLYFSILAVGISVLVLGLTGFSKIVLLCTSVLSIGNAIYYEMSSPRQRTLVGFFSILGLAGLAFYLFAPQTISPFGWDEMVNMVLSAVVGKVAVFAFYSRRKLVID